MTDTDQNNFIGTVLLIEDDLMLTRLYEEKFSIEGFRVLTAHDGESGLEIALKEPVNIVLLDVSLPRASGLEILQKLRKTDKGKTLPVIILTNAVEVEGRRKAVKLGASEYLVKAMQTPEQVVNKAKEHMVN